MRSRSEEALSMVGLATRAGRTVNGSDNCEIAIKRDKLFLLLTATDISPQTELPLVKLCGHRGVPILKICDRNDLGRFTGKDSRVAVGIADKGFADRIISIING